LIFAVFVNVDFGDLDFDVWTMVAEAFLSEVLMQASQVRILSCFSPLNLSCFVPLSSIVSF
jgi:hypothetical protein